MYVHYILQGILCRTRIFLVPVFIKEKKKSIWFSIRAVQCRPADQTLSFSTQGCRPLEAIVRYCLWIIESFAIAPSHCICSVTRGGIYAEIKPKPEGNPEGGAKGISLRAYSIFQLLSRLNSQYRHFQVPTGYKFSRIAW